MNNIINKIHSLLGIYISSFVLLSGENVYADFVSINKQIQDGEGSLDKLSNITNEIDSVLTNDAASYFKSYNFLGSVLEHVAKTNPAALTELKSQSEMVLNKQCSTNPAVQINCLEPKLQIAERLTRNFSNCNLKDAQILAKFLGEVRTAIITNYQRADVLANVMPPIAPTNSRIGVFSGMDPKVIADPTARAAYERAIAENNERGDENDLQFIILPEINLKLTPLFLGYVRTLFAFDSEAKIKANSLIISAHLTKDEQKQLD